MAERGIPDFLTVTEAARILRIGRTAAYEQARLWRETAGREGLPVSPVGAQLRVPTALFEQHYGVNITTDPREAGGGQSSQSALRNIASTQRAPARKRRRGDTQDGLPFAR